MTNITHTHNKGAAELVEAEVSEEVVLYKGTDARWTEQGGGGGGGGGVW